MKVVNRLGDRRRAPTFEGVIPNHFKMNTRSILFYSAALSTSLATAQQPGELDLDLSGDGIATAHFAPVGSDAAMGMAIQPDGRIVVVGSTQQDTQTSWALARFMSDGTLDASFGTGGQVITTIGSHFDDAMAVALQANGQIVVVGSSFENGSGYRLVVARYNADGSLDSGFGTNGLQITTTTNGGRLTCVAIRDDGYIVAGGLQFGGTADEKLLVARYTPSGEPDVSFDGEGFAIIDITPDDDAGADIALEPDGDILVVGYCGVGADAGMVLVRLAENGSLDSSFDGDGIVITQLSSDQDAANTVVRQPADGKILVGGVTMFMPMVFLVVARYNTDGSLDSSFGNNGIFQSPHPGLNFPGNMVLAPDGRIVIGGTWATNFLVAVVNPDGTADMGFDDDGVVTTSFGQNGSGNDLALDANGKAVLVGYSGQGAPTGNDFVVLRYHTGIDVGISETSSAGPMVSVSPNPISNDAVLRLSMTSAGRVSVQLLDASGRRVLTITDGAMLPVGEHVITFTTAALAAGCYQLVVRTGRETSSVMVAVE